MSTTALRAYSMLWALAVLCMMVAMITWPFVGPEAGRDKVGMTGMAAPQGYNVLGGVSEQEQHRSPRFPVCRKMDDFASEVEEALGGRELLKDEERQVLDAKNETYTLLRDICGRPRPADLLQDSRIRGVVYTGTEKHLGPMLLSAYALRVAHASRLLIEAWVPRTDIEACRTKLESTVEGLKCRELPDGVKGWMSKMVALKLSRFTDIIFMDADSFPAVDPAFLFDAKEYKESGAIFWPDYWGYACKDVSGQAGVFGKAAAPEHLFYKHRFAGLEWKEDWEHAQEAETGQFVLDKQRLSDLLDLVSLWTEPQSFYQRDLYGDKDAFRFAWLMARQPFHYVSLPPGHTGIPVEEKGAIQRNGVVQFFPNTPEPPSMQSPDHDKHGGRPVFFHQLTLHNPEAYALVAVPHPSKRTHEFSYCARLHGDYFVWGIDERQGEFIRAHYGDHYRELAHRLFDFIQEKGLSIT